MAERNVSTLDFLHRHGSFAHIARDILSLPDGHHPNVTRLLDAFRVARPATQCTRGKQPWAIRAKQRSIHVCVVRGG